MRQIELHFITFENHLLLNKVVFFDPGFESPRISLRSDLAGNRSAYGAFAWTAPIKTFSLLLISHLLRRRLLAETYSIPEIALLMLRRDLDLSAEWLHDLFGLDGEGRPLHQKLLSGSGGGEVVVEPEGVDCQGITVILNDQVLEKAEELLQLQRELAASLQQSLQGVTPRDVISAPLPAKINNPKIHREIRETWSNEIPGKVVRLYSKQRGRVSRVQGNKESNAELQKFLKRELVINLCQHTEIKFLNKEGDSRIKFSFELINCSMKPLLSRTHQFWFDQPQEEVEFRCSDGKGDKLDFHIARAFPDFRQINIKLPRQIGPLERFKYQISYLAKGTPRANHYYYLSPRTVTRRLIFTVIGSADFNFSDAYVTHESRDGFLIDEPPQIVVTQNGNLQRMEWECVNANPGDLLRTFWTDAVTNSRSVSDSEQLSGQP